MVGYGSRSVLQCTYRSTYLHHLTAFYWPEHTRASVVGRLLPPKKSFLCHTQRLRRVLCVNSRREAKPKRFALWTWTCRKVLDIVASLVSPVFERYLYTVPEAARLLSCSRSTLYELMKTGKVLAVYPTSSARIPASSLDAYVRDLVSQSHASRHHRQWSIR